MSDIQATKRLCDYVDNVLTSMKATEKQVMSSLLAVLMQRCKNIKMPPVDFRKMMQQAVEQYKEAK